MHMHEHLRAQCCTVIELYNYTRYSSAALWRKFRKRAVSLRECLWDAELMKDWGCEVRQTNEQMVVKTMNKVINAEVREKNESTNE